MFHDLIIYFKPEKTDPFGPHIRTYLYIGSYPPSPVISLQEFGCCTDYSVSLDGQKNKNFGKRKKEGDNTCENS